MKKKPNNPKHNQQARRKNQGKWIGGRFISRPILEHALKQSLVNSKRTSFWWRIIFWIKKLWRKLKK